MITPIEVAPATVPGPVKVSRLTAGSRKQLVFKLTDALGKPVDLRAEQVNPPAPLPNFGNEPPANTFNVTMRLKSRSGGLFGPPAFDVLGTLLDEKGFVEFLLTDKETAFAGLYASEIGRFAGDFLTETWPALILIEPSVFAPFDHCQGPLTIPEIRLALLDVDTGTDGAPFNNLIDGVEFSDMEIAFAIKRIVDMWNETPPQSAYFAYNNFPYRYWWIQGAGAILLRSGAARYRRNRLAYSAGGVSVDDQSKANEYQQTGDAMMKEFNDWMHATKVGINMNYCWGYSL